MSMCNTALFLRLDLSVPTGKQTCYAKYRNAWPVGTGVDQQKIHLIVRNVVLVIVSADILSLEL